MPDDTGGFYHSVFMSRVQDMRPNWKGTTLKSEFGDPEAIRKKIQSIPDQLPILPLRDAVIFPTAVMPLTVGRESSVQLVNEVQDSNVCWRF